MSRLLSDPAPTRMRHAPPVNTLTGWPAQESAARITDAPCTAHAPGEITASIRSMRRQSAASSLTAAAVSAGLELAPVAAKRLARRAWASSAAVNPATNARPSARST
jgi:hypothetical protein